MLRCFTAAHGTPVRSLARAGIRPAETRLFADHALPERPRRKPTVDLWLTSAKCAAKVGADHGGVPVFVLEHELRVPQGLLSAVLLTGPATVIRSRPCP